MSKGHVYILTNEAMPGLVKIGMTTGDPESRASQLYQTGVPMPFEVEFSLLSPNCVELEGAAHFALGDCRVSESREFFRCCPTHARTVLAREFRYQMQQVLHEYLPDFDFVLHDCHVDESAVDGIAKECGATRREVSQAMSELTADEIAPALARVRQREAEKVVTMEVAAE